jgi:hypothetical protein
MLDQKLTVLYLATKGLNAASVRQDLFTTIWFDAVSYPMVARILRETLFAHAQSPAQELLVESDPSVINFGVSGALSDQPLASVRQMAERTCLPKSTVLFHEWMR